MSSNKRQRSVGEGGDGSDRDDEAQHFSKKVAHSTEENAVPGPQPTAVDLTDDPQDATADDASEMIHPCESAQNIRNELASHKDELREFRNEISLLKNQLDKFLSTTSKEPMNDRDELQIKLNVAQDRLKATQDQLEIEQQRLDAAQSKLDLAGTQLNEVKAILEPTKTQCETLRQDIEQIGIIRHSAPYLDIILEEQFLELRDNIRWFTKTYCSHPTLVTSLPADVTAKLRTLSSTPIGHFLRNRFYARRFAEAHIWCLLYDQLLCNPFFIWGTTNTIGKVVEHVLSLASAPRPTREFWRVMTAQLLSDTEPQEARVKTYRDLLISQITPLVNPEQSGNAERHIDTITNEAVQLAKGLTLSRTKCAIRRTEQAADVAVAEKYNDEWMEIIEKCIRQNDAVELVVTPALIQLTNSAGDEFKTPRVLVKAEVCYGQGRNTDDTVSVSNSQADEVEEATPQRPKRVKLSVKATDHATLDEELGDDDDDAEVDDGSGEYNGEKGTHGKRPTRNLRKAASTSAKRT
ncbi:hypothetical protein F5B22DRAFT_645762 [Xylaria bambusicola]|uniref:uncharacterized protein n=1 Tax=Xylaria bambusicola TaxID=326684 RepID=UPI002007C764|nr:uncharacterized protein F5B22DRAFT_645762 [Xylaria bambusicola]KAI0517581.1 hypothetical protein F5B22DRAFT_645762 [Xylaria bambusicola]